MKGKHLHSNNPESGLAILVLLLVIIAAFFSIYLGWVELGQGVLERIPPNLTIANRSEIKGLGVEPRKFLLKLSDQGMGLDEVVVRAEARREKFDIVTHKFNGEKEAEFSFEMGGATMPFDEGELDLEIKVFDRSFWFNSKEEHLKLAIDKKAPKVSVVSSQHNAQEGGSQLVIYKTKEENLKSSGVMVGNRKYLGFKARDMDPEMRDDSLFGVFYSVPLASNIKENKILVFAQDAVGNIGTHRFYNKISPRRFGQALVHLKDDFVDNKLDSLLESYKADLEKVTDKSPQNLFNFLNTNIRKFEDSKITSICKSATLSKRNWSTGFIMGSGNPLYRFGERLEFMYKGNTWSQLTNKGYDLQLPLSSTIYAVQDGEVLDIETYSVFGKTIIINHGLGLTSVYSGLGSILVKKGDKITPERPVGTSGESGLRIKPGYYFEFRIDGDPVNPVEWWDREWVKDHLEAKIKESKRALGLQEMTNIE